MAFTTTIIRKKKDFAQCQEFCQNDPHLEIALWDKSFDRLKLIVKGLENTPFEGGKFAFEIKLHQTYPNYPPFVHCHTPIWHPNFNNSVPKDKPNIKLIWLIEPSYFGMVNSTTKEVGWGPSKNLVDLVRALKDLIHMKRPIFKPSVAHNDEASAQFLRQRKKFNDTAKKWTLKHAMGE